MNYELTIVIPVYNRAGIVGRTLDSVRHQTLRPLRVVLVDNNSSDETLHELRAWQEHVTGPGFEVTVVEEDTPGAAAARNRGLEEVTTPFTMFFDSDDLMAPGHAARALAGLKSPEKPDIVGWDVVYRFSETRSALKKFYATDPLWHCVMHGSMATLRYAARTEIFRRAGLWNPSDSGWDDVELGLRMLTLNPAPRLMRLDGPSTVTVFPTPDSITGEAFSPSAWRWETSLDSMENTLRRAGRPTEAIDLRRAHLAGLYIAEGDPEEGHRLICETCGHVRSYWKRLLLQAASRYTAIGGRGVARIMRPFFKI